MNNEKILLKQSALWALYESLTSAYLVAFALALGAQNTLIGFIGAIPWIATILTQIPGSELAEHYKRTTVYVTSTFIGRLCWIPIIAAPFMSEEPLVFITAFYLLARLLESMTDPSWTSLMADIVPTKKLGGFSSKRYLRISLFGMIGLALAGLWLKQFPKESPDGFGLLFAIGLLFGIMATLIMRKVNEPPYADHVHHSIKEFFTLDGPIKKFVRFSMAFNFAYMFASPFFAVYLLKNLGINYAFYGIAMSVTPITEALISRHIGKLTDKYGDKSMAILGSMGIALVPLLYLLVTKESLWLLIPVQIISGTVWAATNISRFNLLIGLTDPKKRALQVAEFHFFTSMSLIIAPILGGWISENATFILAGIPLIFVISSILRFLASLTLFGIPEPRAKKEYPLVYVFRHAIQFHPNKGMEHGIQVVKRAANNMFYK